VPVLQTRPPGPQWGMPELRPSRSTDLDQRILVG
jgi:hypothetical protein